MTTNQPRHRRIRRDAVLSILALAIVSILVLFVGRLFLGESLSTLLRPGEWLQQFDTETARDFLFTASELLAAILAIAVTVIAIVVELAANRYSHRITWLFVREPVNIVVLCFFVLATLQTIWFAVTLDSSTEATRVVAITMILLTITLVTLLPYFAFVLSFLSPVSVIEKIRHTASRALSNVAPGRCEESRIIIQNSIDELQDIARRTSELSDRAVAMASVNAFYELLTDYEDRVDTLPDEWFEISPTIAADPDFVSLGDTTLREIEADRSWVEFKVIRQFLSLVSQAGLESRDIVYLIAINTKHVGVAAIQRKPQITQLCVRSFNSYMRATINARDQRTAYYILNQYRQLAENLLVSDDSSRVIEIARHLQYYGHLSFKLQLPFLLEVVAHDVVELVKMAAEKQPALVDELLTLALDLDREIKEDFDEESLNGVRLAQIQLGVYFLQREDTERATKIAADMQDEDPRHLQRVYRVLQSEDRSQFWEITDRGVNFSYLPPALRVHLDPFYDLLVSDPR